MQSSTGSLSRRELMAHGGRLGLGAMLAGSSARLFGQGLDVLDVAYAGSMGSLMEGPLKHAAAASLKLEIHGRAQGANALAQLIVGGSIRPDVFVPITPGPMLAVLHAGKAESAQPVARTEMVIAYSPKSRFAAKLDAAAAGKAKWWEVLEEPGFRFGRTDPATDPQGRNIIFAMMLAAREYGRPELVEKTLGHIVNPQQISMEAGVQARLQSGELDAASAYRIQPGPFHLPYIPLAPAINLGGARVHEEHPEISLAIGEKTYFPEPLVYYAAVLKDAANPGGAKAFVEWLQGAEARDLFRQNDYDAPGDAPALHA